MFVALIAANRAERGATAQIAPAELNGTVKSCLLRPPRAAEKTISVPSRETNRCRSSPRVQVRCSESRRFVLAF